MQKMLSRKNSRYQKIIDYLEKEIYKNKNKREILKRKKDWRRKRRGDQRIRKQDQRIINQCYSDYQYRRIRRRENQWKNKLIQLNKQFNETEQSVVVLKNEIDIMKQQQKKSEVKTTRRRTISKQISQS